MCERDSTSGWAHTSTRDDAAAAAAARRRSKEQQLPPRALSRSCESESESALVGHLVLLLLPVLPHPHSNDLDLMITIKSENVQRHR